MEVFLISLMILVPSVGFGYMIFGERKIKLKEDLADEYSEAERKLTSWLGNKPLFSPDQSEYCQESIWKMIRLHKEALKIGLSNDHARLEHLYSLFGKSAATQESPFGQLFN